MIKLKAVGDIMLDRLVDQNLRNKKKLYPFEHITKHLKADIVFGNLECPLSNRGTPETNSNPEYRFRAKPEMATRLKTAGFNIVSLANNHIFNHSTEAFLDTIKILKKNKILYVGAGLNEEQARKPVIIEKNNLKIGFLAYTYSYSNNPSLPSCAPLEIKKIKKDIQKLRPSINVLVISLHDGIEFLDYPASKMRKIARKSIDYGADIVLGHHPHTLQGIEYYKNSLIVYSLGDFVFDNVDENIRKAAYKRTAISVIKNKALPLNDLRTLESVILECKLSKKGLQEYQLVPIKIGDDFQPRIADRKGAKKILSRLKKISQPLQNDYHPVWKEMNWIENKVEELSLGQLPIKDALKLIKKIKFRHILKIPLYLKIKLLSKIKK